MPASFKVKFSLHKYKSVPSADFAAVSVVKRDDGYHDCVVMNVTRHNAVDEHSRYSLELFSMKKSAKDLALLLGVEYEETEYENQ